MFSAHSWQWLTPRLTTRKIAPDKAPPSRPPLAAIEALDDRILLSAVPVADNGSTAILIGLLKGNTSLVQDQLDFLKLVAADTRKDKWLPQLTTDFLKIDGLLYKFGDALINTDAKYAKFDTIQQQLNQVFTKVDNLLPSISPSNELLTAAWIKIRESASGILTSLSDLPAVQASHKVVQPLLKLNQDFLKIDTLFLKLGEDLLIKDNLVQDKHFYMKLQALFQEADGSVSKFGLSEQLLPAVRDAQNQVNTTLASLGSKFTGGPTLENSPGDVIG